MDRTWYVKRDSEDAIHLRSLGWEDNHLSHWWFLNVTPKISPREMQEAQSEGERCGNGSKEQR